MSIPELLSAAVVRDPARPFLTFYDHATGERIELSRATTANWVAKTANMLQDSLGAENGSTVLVDLPSHWSRAVWMLSAWEVGCRVGLAADGFHDVAVVGPSVLTGPAPDADETVALSLRPLGGRFVDDLPPGVIDYNTEVLGHGDHFTAYDRPVGDATALECADGAALDHDACIAAATERASRWESPAPRVLTGGGADDRDIMQLLLAPLIADGSIVLVANPDPDRLDALVADEHVTVTESV